MSKCKGWSPFVRQCFVTSAVGINTVGHGCTFGYPAVLLPRLAASSSDSGQFTLTTEEASWIASVSTITMLVGCLVSPLVMDRRGRRQTLLAVTAPAVAGWLVAAGATSFAELFASRFLLGISLGMSLPLRSVLIGEYTSPKYRGAFLTTVSLTQATGIFLVHLVGSILSWQVTALVSAMFPFIGMTMVLYSPESPSYLAAKGRYDECRAVFTWLRGTQDNDELEELISARMELNDMTTETPFGFKQVLLTLRRQEFYKPIFIMLCANMMMQFCGGTTFAAYSPLIIKLILGNEANADFWMIFLDGQRIFINLLAMYFINKYKRRMMFVTIGSICVCSHLAISGYVFGDDRGYLPYRSQWITILLLNIQFFTVAAGMVPLPSVIAGEIFPLQYRSIGGCISMVSIALSSFVVLKTFPNLITNAGIHGAYLLYAGIIAILLFFIWLTLPETKGKTLQEIEDEFKTREPGSAQESERLQQLQHIERRRRKMSTISAISLAVDM